MYQGRIPQCPLQCLRVGHTAEVRRERNDNARTAQGRGEKGCHMQPHTRKGAICNPTRVEHKCERATHGRGEVRRTALDRPRSLVRTMMRTAYPCLHMPPSAPHQDRCMSKSRRIRTSASHPATASQVAKAHTCYSAHLLKCLAPGAIMHFIPDTDRKHKTQG